MSFQPFESMATAPRYPRKKRSLIAVYRFNLSRYTDAKAKLQFCKRFFFPSPRLRPRLFLLLGPQTTCQHVSNMLKGRDSISANLRVKTNTGDLDDLEANTGDISLGLALTTETGEEDLVVLVDEVQTTVIGN